MPSRQADTLVVNALYLAFQYRRPGLGDIVFVDRGVLFTSQAFGNRMLCARLLPSFGSVGEGLDIAPVVSFWSSMQFRVFNRRWKTRVELATVILDYVEIFHALQRRYSALGLGTPNEFENSPNPTPV